MNKTQRKHTCVLMTNKKTVSVIFFRRLSCVNPTDIAEEATQTQTHRCNLKATTMCFVYLFVPWQFVLLPCGTAGEFPKVALHSFFLWSTDIFFMSILTGSRTKSAMMCNYWAWIISVFLDVLSCSLAAFCKCFHSDTTIEGYSKGFCLK